MDKIMPNAIGFTSRPASSGLNTLLRKVFQVLIERRIPFVVDAVLKPFLMMPYPIKFVDFKKLPDEVDVIVVLGGDGTLIHAIHNIPKIEKRFILGVNTGRIGFLSEITPHDLVPCIMRILNGEEVFIERVKLMRVNMSGRYYDAINDVVIMNKEHGRMISVGILVDDEPVYTTYADGVIVSTSTGSTAYSASAGGPIIDPRMSVFIVNFICPLMWSIRPLIVPGDVKLKVRVRARKGIVLVDGMEVSSFNNKIEVMPEYSEKSVKFIRFTKGSFYKRLYRRLNMWI
ncbi:MAG: hypothetical protein DRJ66_00620 [Thermoprotei archaeon]|nr:MAG: hypothetical protein DRJ66_00620 [Thermoprotei archaeon]RLF19440.1 MAG: hypothetical protein DRZ82_05715 [Thermoprotei archaeon]